jgi:hypothetical protein
VRKRRSENENRQQLFLNYLLSQSRMIVKSLSPCLRKLYYIKLQPPQVCKRRCIFTNAPNRRWFSEKHFQDSNNDDVIEAEIINDSSQANRHNGEDFVGWNTKRLGRMVSVGFNKAKEMVGMDARSIQRRHERRRVDAEIDKALSGTGEEVAVAVWQPADS